MASNSVIKRFYIVLELQTNKNPQFANHNLHFKSTIMLILEEIHQQIQQSTYKIQRVLHINFLRSEYLKQETHKKESKFWYICQHKAGCQTT